MSNIKSFDIAAEVPFNYLENFTDEDSKLWGSLFMAPAIGLELHYGASRFEDSANGGKTAIYSLTITGSDAIAWPMVDRIKHILEVHGSVQTFEVVDIEDNLIWPPACWCGEPMTEEHRSEGCGKLVRSFDQGEWQILRLDYSDMAFNRMNFVSETVTESLPVVERVSVGGAVIFEGKQFNWKTGPNVFD